MGAPSGDFALAPGMSGLRKAGSLAPTWVEDGRQQQPIITGRGIKTSPRRNRHGPKHQAPPHDWRFLPTHRNPNAPPATRRRQTLIPTHTRTPHNRLSPLENLLHLPPRSNPDRRNRPSRRPQDIQTRRTNLRFNRRRPIIGTCSRPHRRAHLRSVRYVARGRLLRFMRAF